MLLSRRIWALILVPLALVAPRARADGPTVVRGRVVTSDGQPAVGVQVGTLWSVVGNDPKIRVADAVTTDAEGGFALDMNFHYGRSRAIVALDAAATTGGMIVVVEADARGPVEIKLGPLVTVHGPVVSESVDHPLTTLNVLVMLDLKGRPVVADWWSYRRQDAQLGQTMPKSAPAEWQMRLPAGPYRLYFREPTAIADHLGAGARVEVRADEPGLDLAIKPVTMSISPLAKLRDQAPPALAIRDARGVTKDVKLGDFRGKWVVLEFWTTTCGPCIGRGLPELMHLVDDHAADADRFAVLAIHGPGAEDMAELDRKLVPIIRDTWSGRSLPFPMLIDDDGRTFAAFGVQAIPMTVVINPAGRIAPGGLEELIEALPEVPVATRVARALDRETLHNSLDGAGPGEPLGATLKELGGMTAIAIRPDLDAWKAVGIAPATRVPLSVVGPVSLRTWLRLMFEPLGLVAVPDAEGLLITTPRPGAIPFDLPPDRAHAAAARLQNRLDDRFTLTVPTRALAEVLDELSQVVGESFVIAPAARKLGQIDPRTPVACDLKDAPLGPALRALLEPIGLEAVIRADVILIQVKPGL